MLETNEVVARKAKYWKTLFLQKYCIRFNNDVIYKFEGPFSKFVMKPTMYKIISFLPRYLGVSFFGNKNNYSC